MRRLAFPVLFLAFLLPTPLRAEEAHRELRPVLRMVEGGQYLEAVGLLKEVIEVARDPLLRAQGLKVEGDILSYWLDQPQAALKAYQGALQGDLLEEDRAAALFNLAMIHYQSRRYREAETAFQGYLSEFPSHLRAQTARFLLGRAQRRAKEPPKALPPLSETKPSAPQDRPEQEIVVAVLKGVPSATIEAEAEILLRLPQGGERVFRSPLRVTLREGEIRVGGQSVPDGEEVESRAGRLKIEGKSYRGVLILGRGKGGPPRSEPSWGGCLCEGCGPERNVGKLALRGS